MYISLVYKDTLKIIVAKVEKCLVWTVQIPKKVKRMSPESGGRGEAQVSLAVQFLLWHWGSKGRDSLQVSRKPKSFDS